MGNKLKYTLDTIHVVSDHIKDLINNYTIFLFEGDMGSGKTTLIKQVVKDIGISENVKSPTFSLVNEYIENDLIIFHFDLYRINKENELDSIGFYEYLDSGKLCFIECGSRCFRIKELFLWEVMGGSLDLRPDVWQLARHPRHGYFASDR